MKSAKTVLLFTIFTLIIACSNNQQQPLPDFEQLVMKHYIEPFKNAETDRWMEVFADDAVGMHNTMPPFVGK